MEIQSCSHTKQTPPLLTPNRLLHCSHQTSSSTAHTSQLDFHTYSAHPSALLQSLCSALSTKYPPQAHASCAWSPAGGATLGGFGNFRSSHLEEVNLWEQSLSSCRLPSWTTLLFPFSEHRHGSGQSSAHSVHISLES